MRPGTFHTEDDELEDEIERILREQKTHELTCPVCNSCVTKGLITRKRKRLLISTEDSHRLANSRRNCEEIIHSLVCPPEDVYDVQEKSQPAYSSPTIIVDVDTDPEDEECWGCASCFPCLSFFRDTDHGKFARQRSMKNAVDYRPDDRTPLLRN